jgi:hypothetical protein
MNEVMFRARFVDGALGTTLLATAPPSPGPTLRYIRSYISPLIARLPLFCLG